MPAGRISLNRPLYALPVPSPVTDTFKLDTGQNQGQATGHLLRALPMPGASLPYEFPPLMQRRHFLGASAAMLLAACSFGPKPEPTTPPTATVPPVATPPRPVRIGLALGGGAARG